MNSSPLQKILVVRTDRIGDVLLTLPVVPLLREAFPTAEIWFLARTYTRELIEHQPDVHGVLVVDEGEALKPLPALGAELRRHQFDAAIVVHPEPRLAILMKAAAIPLRIGTGYRWYSFLFNRRVYEHRKSGSRHEAEHNVSLLKAMGVKAEEVAAPRLHPSPASRERAEAVWRREGLDQHSHVAVLHPGSGGSARDWRPERFGELAVRLQDAGIGVAVTGGPGEEALVRRVKNQAGRPLASSVGEFSLDELSAFLERAELVVANSTGPLHIAAAVGVPVIGFYPPIPQCSSRRWGPLTDRKVIFEPTSAECPRCRGGVCQGDDCMQTIQVEEVFRAACTLMGIPQSTAQTPATA